MCAHCIIFYVIIGEAVSHIVAAYFIYSVVIMIVLYWKNVVYADDKELT